LRHPLKTQIDLKKVAFYCMIVLYCIVEIITSVIYYQSSLNSETVSSYNMSEAIGLESSLEFVNF